MPRLCSQGMEPRLFQDVLDQLHLRLLDAYTTCRVLRLESDESKEFEAEHHQADGESMFSTAESHIRIITEELRRFEGKFDETSLRAAGVILVAWYNLTQDRLWTQLQTHVSTWKFQYRISKAAGTFPPRQPGGAGIHVVDVATVVDHNFDNLESEFARTDALFAMFDELDTVEHELEFSRESGEPGTSIHDLNEDIAEEYDFINRAGQ